MPKLQRLNVAIERAERLRIQNKQHESLTLEIKELANSIEKQIIPLLDKAQKINKSEELTPAGKTKRIQDLTQQALGIIASIDPANQLTRDIELTEAKVTNKLAVINEKRKTADQTTKLIDHLRQAEARQMLIAAREQAKAGHQARIKTLPGPLSDEERAFKDPVEEIFLQRCQAYNEQDIIVRAIQETPLPMISNEALAAGQDHIKGVVAAAELAEQAKLTTKREMVKELVNMAKDIASNPIRNTPVEEPYFPVADKGE